MSKSLEIHTAEPAHVQIRKYYQHQIRTGVLKPGDPLPSTQEMAEQWSISCSAVQKALANLVAAGLLERTRRRGTFVSRSTEEMVIGVLIGPRLADESAHFYRMLLGALQEEIAAHRDVRNWNCRSYDGLTTPEQTTPPPTAYRQLLRDLENYSFKGLVEIARGINWQETFSSGGELPVTNIDHDVLTPITHFFDEALRWLAARRIKRVACVSISGPYPPVIDPILGAFDAADSHGFEHPEIIAIAVKGTSRERHQMIHEKMAQVVRRWRDPDGSYRGPEALIVSDDIAMRSVALALIQENIRIPEEITIVCKTMEECQLYYGIPVNRYAFSVNALAKQILEILWKRIVGETLPPLPIAIEGRMLVW